MDLAGVAFGLDFQAPLRASADSEDPPIRGCIYERRAGRPLRLKLAIETAEFTLAAACCRPPGGARTAAVHATAAGPVDWRRFERVLTRHRIEGLANAALGEAGVAGDAALAGFLASAGREIAIGGLRLAAETTRVQSALDKAGVVNLVLKGATLDALAWGAVGLKRAWDIDLLVEPTEARRARQVLQGAGYALREPDAPDDAAFDAWAALAKECVFVHRTSGLVVELHWRLVDASGLLPGLSARSAAQSVRLSDTLELRTLAAEPLFAYLCVHGASHAWSRLKWLADLGALWARGDDAARTALYRGACALGAGNCPATAVLLCERLLGVAPPETIAPKIQANSKARSLAALAIDAMTHGGGETEIADRPLFQERILLSSFRFADGWRYRWAEWTRQAVSIDDRLRFPLPARLAFLYAPMRAPLWIWRRIRRRFTRASREM
jgi:hypothetical protein